MKCLYCSKSFTPSKQAKAAGKKYCSPKCRYRYWNEKSRGQSFAKEGISTGTVGAMSELLASIDLMRRGFEVYRALSPSSSCDLIALKNSRIYKFEVRTAYRNQDGSINYSKTSIRADRVVAILLRENVVVYIPKLKR